MILHDRIEVLRVPDGTPDGTVLGPGATVAAVLPAHVGHSSVMAADEPGAAVQVVEELRAIIEPWPWDHTTHRARWRGVEYRDDGPPMVRRKRGRDHHFTIRLKRVLA